MHLLGDAAEIYLCYTGKIVIAYISQVLLCRQPKLNPTLDSFRLIAQHFVDDDFASDPTIDKHERYEDYTRRLSQLLVSQSYSQLDSIVQPRQYTGNSEIVKHDLASAAAYMGKLHVVQEAFQDERYGTVGCNTLNRPYFNASLGGHIPIMEYIFQVAERDGSYIDWRWYSALEGASAAGHVEAVAYLLESKWNPGTNWPYYRPDRNEAFTEFHRALYTKHIGTFNLLMDVKSKTYYKSLSQEQLAKLLTNAAEEGWKDMVNHLLGLGAPLDGDAYESPDCQPLRAACRRGTEEVVRLLLHRGAKMTGMEINAAAARGRLTIVKILLEHGTNANGVPFYKPPGNHEIRLGVAPPPIVSAVRLEQKGMFRLLVEYGADLKEVGSEAVKVAREDGLDSMLEMLEEYNVSIEDDTKRDE